MKTHMPLCEELASVAGSSLVRDMMIVRYRREVSVVMVDKGELIKKAQGIRARVAERDFVIAELELLYPFDSCVQSISELTKLETEDLAEAAALLVKVMNKQKQAHELLLFIEKLKDMVY